MLRNDYTGQECSVARSLEIVGERWTLLIVRELMLKGPRRFLELEKNLRIAKNVLKNRLDKLAEHEIVQKVSLNDSGSWGEYRLTDKGRDLFPVINAFIAWGDRYAAPNGPPLVLGHNSCGHRVGHKVVCECCGEPVVSADVHVIS